MKSAIFDSAKLLPTNSGQLTDNFLTYSSILVYQNYGRRGTLTREVSSRPHHTNGHYHFVDTVHVLIVLVGIPGNRLGLNALSLLHDCACMHT